MIDKRLDSDDIENKNSNKLIVLLYTLVFMMVFEGVVRKILPSINIAIFLLKDLLCIIGLYLVITSNEDKRISAFKLGIRILSYLFIPIFMVTVLYEPAIAIFGIKQYLLYISVAFMFCYAFGSHNKSAFNTFVYVFTLLLIPTTGVAVLQSTLPASHWLNSSVSGESMEAFSVDGVLRVCSTFSFTGQYSFYLNAAGAFLGLRIFIVEKKFLGSVFDGILVGILVLSLIIGCFITGGRTAVLGLGLSSIIALLLITYKQPKLVFQKVWIWAIAGFLLFGAIRTALPQFFEAYEKRQKDDEETNELETRLINSFLEESEWVADLSFVQVLMGQGIGVMSNGSEKISSYSLEKRTGGFWTENDFQSTLWEGGLYLVAVWYGFRFFIIIFCISKWARLTHRPYLIGGAFLVGFITVSGVVSLLGIQNTIAIWWWCGVGAFLCITLLDKKNT